MSQPIIRIVRLSFKLENTESFIKIFEESQSKILAFEGCLSVEMKRDYHHNHVFYTLSRWQSQEALDRYRNSELFQSTWARTKVLFDDKPQAYSLVE